VAGGLATAFARGAELGCTALQVFVKSPSRWQGRELDEAEVAAFHAARAGQPSPPPVLAHAAYLINLASPPGAVLERSRAALGDELERCRRLGIAGLVVHPGSAAGVNEEEGLRRVATALDVVLAATPPGATRVLLETTAGQGACLGWRLEQLERVLELAACRDELAVCLDTCHLFAAGYPLHAPGGVESLLAEAVRRFGRERIAAVHLNDSRHPLGSRRDRHANIGEGSIGKPAFAALLAAPELRGVPLVLETPGGDDEQGHRRDLATLRALLTSC
jgi:deoxyribonuclease-4